MGYRHDTLYNNLDIKREIEGYRQGNVNINRVIDMRSQVETRDTEINNLKAKNIKLKTIMKKLRRQLEVVYGELYKRNI